MNRKHLVACIRSPCTQVQVNRACARNTDVPLAAFFDQRLKLQLQDRTRCIKAMVCIVSPVVPNLRQIQVFSSKIYTAQRLNPIRIPLALINDVPQARSSEIRKFNFWIACCIKGCVDRVRVSRWFSITSTDKTGSSTSISFFYSFLLLRPTQQCYAFT